MKHDAMIWLAHTRIEAAKENTKRLYDDKIARLTTIYKPGDTIWVKNQRRSRKLDDEWLGPYKIIDTNTYNNITVDMDRKPKRIHTDNTKLCVTGKNRDEDHPNSSNYDNELGESSSHNTTE